MWGKEKKDSEVNRKEGRQLFEQREKTAKWAEERIDSYLNKDRRQPSEQKRWDS